MTELLTLLLLLLLQFLAGFGLLSILKIRLDALLLISISMLAGIGICSFIPFLMQLAYIPLTALNISIAMVIVTWLLNLRMQGAWQSFWQQPYRFRFRLYDLPFLLAIIFLVLISIWRCYYLPPTPRDLTSGAEVIAEYTIREKTMINSLFTVNLESTNNPFKPPFITCLQVIYKYAGFAFGQLWLSILFVSFLVFLYGCLRRYLHSLLAGALLLVFIAIPEMYAYTFMALYDYANAVYFCLSLWFLFEYFKNRQHGYLVSSGIIMAMATYIRSETLILAVFAAVPLFWHEWKKKTGPLQLAAAAGVFILPAVFMYVVSVTIYINYYLPVKYQVENLIRQDLWNPQHFIRRFWELNDDVIFSNNGVNYYGYFIFVFIGILLVDAIWKERWDTRSLNWLYGVLVIYFGLPFIAQLFPLFDLDHSTKRGLFKMFPLMLLYMANSRFLIHVSGRMKSWESTV